MAKRRKYAAEPSMWVGPGRTKSDRRIDRDWKARLLQQRQEKVARLERVLEDLSWFEHLTDRWARPIWYAEDNAPQRLTTAIKRYLYDLSKDIDT